MDFTKATSKANRAGVRREDWRGLDRRAVLLDGHWFVVEDDDEHAGAEIAAEDRKAEDWYPLEGNEWAMTSEVKRMPPLRSVVIREQVHEHGRDQLKSPRGAVSLTCPSCKTEIKPPTRVGVAEKEVTCPSCKHRFRISL